MSSQKIRRGWLPLREAVVLSGMSANTLRALADDGDIRSGTTKGGHRRFDPESIEQFITRGEVDRLAIQRALSL
jgi:hypothetical protein